jgi:cytochrome oxidase Cu insertion factor (SCO1/SenC/PrrC family)
VIDASSEPPGERPNVDRKAAFARGAPDIPRRFVWAVVGVLVVLGGGGVLLERGLTALGLNPSTGPVSTPTVTATTVPALPRSAGPIAAGGPALMNLTDLGAPAAPAISLVDAAGRKVSLTGFRGRVVVLSFFDARCDDICPILGAEIIRADDALGPASRGVAFVTVNTDPLAPQMTAAPARVFAGQAPPANWTFLSGTLHQLDQVWSAYGVSVDVDRSSGVVSHNDLMYFLSPNGRLRYLATPFANETTSGSYSLPAAVIASWGQGIARVTVELAG